MKKIEWPERYIWIVVALAAAMLSPKVSELKQPPTKTPVVTATARPPKRTPKPSITPTRIVNPSNTPTVSHHSTVTVVPTGTRLPPSSDTRPFPGAPLCPDSGAAHDNNKFHTLWDASRGCHYDHEHGQDPFTPEVANAFPGFDLRALLGGVGIGHTNPSSPVENTHKHGGFKWQVGTNPVNINEVFEGGANAVKRYAIQFHAFGRQDVEHEARQHSSVAMLEMYKIGNPDDVGYMYVVQLQEYGQRVTPYQGYILPYPDQFLPTWASPRGPYFTNECVGADIPMPPGMSDLGVTLADCRTSRSGHISTNGNVNSVWTSKPTGVGSTNPALRPPVSSLFRLLFRIRDGYQMMDSRDLVHPFTWVWMCSRDGGVTYDGSMPGCRWNNSTATVNEVMGDIPAAWDGAAFDRDPRPGRITADLFVDRFGNLLSACTQAGGNCHPLKLVSAFVGRYSSELQADKVSNPDPFNTPERDIYFLNGQPVSETTPGAVPSGWIGSEN